MTRENQFKLLGEFYAEKKNVLKLKGEDYANETDVLQNFKSAGANCGISAELQCLSLIATKIARLGNLLSGKTPNNESISDSILDLSNYTDLLYCLVNEENENPKFSTGILDDFKKFNDAADKNEAEFLTRTHAKSQPLTPEECSKVGTYKRGLFDPTSQWLKPVGGYGLDPFRDVIGDLNKTIQAGAEWHKKRREESEPVKEKPKGIKEEDIFYKGGEPIKETYEPKVGDKFIDKNTGCYWEIESILPNDIRLKYFHDYIPHIITYSITSFFEEIQDGTLKKIN